MEFQIYLLTPQTRRNSVYYTKDLIQYNLEGIDIVDEDEIKSEERLEERIRMISHINKRRRGKFFTDYRDCEYLLLTGTNDTLNIAKKIAKF